MLNCRLRGTEFNAFGDFLGTSWGHWGGIWGDFWGWLGGSEAHCEADTSFLFSNFLNRKVAPRLPQEVLKHIRNDAKRPLRDSEEGIRTRNFENLKNHDWGARMVRKLTSFAPETV